MMDDNEPAVAVASGTYVYIYKTIRPYFKFSLPILEVSIVMYIVGSYVYIFFHQVNKKEAELWMQLKEVQCAYMFIDTFIVTVGQG